MAVDVLLGLQWGDEGKGKIVDVGHGGAGRYGFPFQNNPGEFAVIRRKLYPAEEELIKT